MHIAGKYGILGILQKLLDWANEKQKAEKIKKLVLATDNVGRTVFLKTVNSRKLNYYKSMAFG